MPQRTLLVLVVVVGMLVVGSRPGDLRADDEADGTYIKLFVPFTQPGSQLNPALRVRAQVTFQGNPEINQGSCQSGSSRTTRPDAWRCGTADPCFAPLLGDESVLACPSDPWSGEVTLLTVPLLPSIEQCRQGPPSCRQELDLTRLPWALELANGARCTMLGGATFLIVGMRVNYGCEGGGSVVGEPDRSHATWHVFFLAPGAFVLEQEEVEVAWY